MHVSHMLYVDDLTLLTNDPRDMRIMLSWLAVYTRKKHLIVITCKSEVVHFNSAGEIVPVFDVGGATLHNDYFRYLGMVFNKTLAKSVEHVSCPFFASAYRIRKFVHEHALADRPHTSLWLAKMYVIPAGLFSGRCLESLVARGQARLFGVAGLNSPGSVSTLLSDSNVSVSLIHACGVITPA